MRFLTFAILLGLLGAFAFIVSGVTRAPEGPDVTIEPRGVLAAAGPQLVTETYLRRELDVSTAIAWSIPVAEAFAGPVHRFTSRVVDVQADTWDRDKMVRLTVVLNDGGGIQRHIPMRWTFAGHDYDLDSGSVTQGACHKLPSAGVATTGEFTTVENGLSTDIEHKISKTVTESVATSTTLDESIELTSGLTIEAGSSTNKVSGTLSTQLGIDKSATEDHSKETSVTVEDTLIVSANTDAAVVFSTDDAAVDCGIMLNAEADWSSITVDVLFPRELHRHYYPDNDYWSRLPASYSNVRLLLAGDAVRDGKGAATITFDEADQAWRLFSGADVRCPHCGGLRFTPAARAAISSMSDPAARWITFDGTRHSTSKRDASYKAYDVTGCSQPVVTETISKAGVAVAHLDRNGNGILDVCEVR